jgi:hypothetical protein
MLPSKRPRPDDPPPTADQFRSSLPFGRKAFLADDDNDEDETTGHFEREEQEAEDVECALPRRLQTATAPGCRLRM